VRPSIVRGVQHGLAKITGCEAMQHKRFKRETIAQVVAHLKDVSSCRVETGAAIRGQHANSLTWIAGESPDGVVWPRKINDVVQIVEIAARYRVPLIPFGAGTSLEGQVNAPLGGLSIDMSEMNRIVAVNPRDFDCRVEAGVTRAMLDKELRHTGLFFPVDPGAAEATLGGMAATRASGTTTVRYGSMRENVVDLVAVMADGSVVRTGRRVRKSAAGFDLTRLLVGSEGLLGIICELTLRLHPVPQSVAAAVTPFASIEGACNAAIAALESGLGVARIELLDGLQIHAVNRHAKLQLEETPTLFVEFHGSQEGVRAQAELFGELARGEGALSFDWADVEEERRRLWAARHEAFWAIRTTWPGKTTVVSDVCVPISRLADCVRETVADLERSGLTAPIVGHVGDGNFHAIPIFDAGDAREVERVRGFLARLVARALAMDGTSTGEHGIGQGKAGFLADEFGAGLAVMKSIKGALDPLGILNPGKVFLDP
jgi:D-lactate dehydrogenase (cytochrome)